MLASSRKIWGRRHDQASTVSETKAGPGRRGRRLCWRLAWWPTRWSPEARIAGKQLGAPRLAADRWPTTRSPRISTCAKIQLAARAVRLARPPAEVRKAVADLQRLQGERGEATGCRAPQPPGGRKPGSGLPKIKALMDGFTTAVEDSSRRRGRPRCSAQIDTRSAVSAEVDQGRRRPG